MGHPDDYFGVNNVQVVRKQVGAWVGAELHSAGMIP
jgi:hypothetical protein